MELIKIHPTVHIIYYLILIVFAMVYNNIYYLASFMAILIVLFYLEGILSKLKTLFKLFVPLALLVIILNPLTNKVGETRIYLFSNYFITLEAFVFGVVMAFSLLLILMILESYNNEISYQEMLYLFSKKFPNTAIIIIMALRFIPLITTRIKELLKINSINNENISKKEKLKHSGGLFGEAIAWSLEESMFTAKSMKARGYGIAQRTSYLSFKFNKIDYILIMIILIAGFLCICGLTIGKGLIQIYPNLDFALDKSPIDIFYISFLVFLLPKIVLEIRERLYWVKL